MRFWSAFPETGSSDCNIAAVWNWKDKTWGIRSIGATNYGATGLIDEVTSNSWDSGLRAGIWTPTWNENAYSQRARLLFAQTSRIGAFDVSSSDDGTTPVTGALERTGIWLDDPGREQSCCVGFARESTRQPGRQCPFSSAQA